MPSDANWRTHPNDPRTLAGWALRGALEEAPQLAANTLLVLLAVAIVVLFCGLGVPPDLTGKWSWWPIRRRKAPSSLASLASMPSAAPWFPIRIHLWQGGVRTGSDEGIATFLDGWLVFEGRRTTFSLRNTDAFSLASDCSRLHLNDGREIETTPYDRLGTQNHLEQGFETALRRWIRSGIPTGTSTLPPTTIHLSAWGRTSGAILLGALFAAPAAALIGQGNYWLLAIAAVVALCGLWRAGQRVIDLIRLRRLTRRCIRCAPRSAIATTPAGTPSSPCPPDRSGAWR